MKLTNNHNISPDIYQLIYDDLLENRPNPDALRVTELINPPLIKHLLLKHWDDLELDASEFLWSFLGKAGHRALAEVGLLEQIKDLLNGDGTDLPTQLENIILFHPAEKQLKITLNGQDITGRTDVRRTGIIRDFKITSVWSFMSGVKPEWEAQENTYGFMARANGLPVDKLIIDAILRDWSISRSFERNYPPVPFISMNVPLWDTQTQRDYIIRRIAIHKAEPVECSPQEKWQKETGFAVKKQGVKKAVAATKKVASQRVLLSYNDALNYVKTHKLSEQFSRGNVYIEERVGECTRCKSYCMVRHKCLFNIHKEA